MMISLVILLLCGAIVTLISSQIYVNRLSAGFLKNLTALIKMNEFYGFDPVWLVKNMDPFLEKMMVRNFSFYLYYLNTEYDSGNALGKKAYTKFVHTSDYTLFLGLEPLRYRLHSRRFTRALKEVLFLMIKSDIILSVKSAERAFQRSNEIQTFINHDVKNLIQFVNMLEYNIKNAVTDEDNKKLTRYLRLSIPGIKSRGDKILAALGGTLPEAGMSVEECDPYEMAASIAGIYSIPAEFTGGRQIKITVNKKVLSIIFENVIKNFYDKSLIEKGIGLRMDVEDIGVHYRIRISDSGSPVRDCEKIFEPFFTGRRGGLGIGLFHCRNVLRSIGGNMKAENTPHGPVFIIDIKKEQGASDE